MPTFTPPLDLITSEIVLSWNPCSEYTSDKIRELIGNGIHPKEVFNLDIPTEDKLWTLFHIEAVGDRLLHEFAVACAEHVLPADCDPRSRAALTIKKQWIEGEATNEDLKIAWGAARDAARDAAWAATRAAAGDTARDAAWAAAAGATAGGAAWAAAGTAAGTAAGDTARDATWAAATGAAAGDAARDAEQNWQLSWLKNRLND